MFGYQWFTIFEKVREQGIEAAKPEVLMLANWCSIYANEKEASDFEEWAVGDWMALHQLLNSCMRIAQRERTWKYEKIEDDVFEDDAVDADESYARNVDQVAPKKPKRRGDRATGPKGVREKRDDVPPRAKTPPRLQLPGQPVLLAQTVRPGGDAAPETPEETAAGPA